jgi:methionyl-tRNA formyltransferase
MRVAFFGTPSWAVPVLDALNRHHQVVLVVTQPDKPKGRGLKPAPSPVAQYALEHGLSPPQARAPQGERGVPGDFPGRNSRGGRNRRLRQDPAQGGPRGSPTASSTSTPPFCPSTGARPPVPWALIRGEKETGVAIMKTEEGLDTGPLYALWRTEILPEEDAVALSERLRDKGIELLLKVLQDLPHLTPTPQEGEASYAPSSPRRRGGFALGKAPRPSITATGGSSPGPGVTSSTRAGGSKF